MFTRSIALIIIFLGSHAMAHDDIPDLYPQSPLYAKPVEVIPHVFSAIGATAPPRYENTGHNNNPRPYMPRLKK